MLWNPDQNLWFFSCHVFDKQREDSMEQLLDYFPQTHQNCLLSTEKWLESSIKKEEEDKVAGWLWVSFYFSVQIPSAMWELLLVALSTLGMVCKKITHTPTHTCIKRHAGVWHERSQQQRRPLKHSRLAAVCLCAQRRTLVLHDLRKRRDKVCSPLRDG